MLDKPKDWKVGVSPALTSVARSETVSLMPTGHAMPAKIAMIFFLSGSRIDEWSMES
jgi:hypothetical protein